MFGEPVKNATRSVSTQARVLPSAAAAGGQDGGSDDRAIVDLRDVTLSFGNSEVLAPTDLQVRRGEFVTLYGPSGCGKSTLLNITAGLLEAGSGQALFDGRPIDGVNRNVGYMTQDDTLLPWQTLRKNVELPLRIRKTPKATIHARLERYLSLLDLTHAADRYPGQLSGGMKRRALLARSMIYEPEMLLMDEPFAAVDATLRDDLHAELRKTIDTTNLTVLFVTHDVTEAVLLSDRVLVLGGRPSTVIGEYRIPFGRNRDLAAIRDSTELVQLQSQIRSTLDSGATHR
ncbi:ABC transporter ATP-binding protein [Janibacter hoylei]|uniref:ABC transporter ATP-binding protein n=1 Tax=Janibacter hoylei TaxID=364298 RepID=UPI0024911E88|nr:ABC transporter ATP-binding protein [Janibacter hoylei]